MVEQLGITRLSKSQVSVMAKDLDAQVEAFRTRPLDAGPYTFLAADALTMKVREAGRVSTSPAWWPPESTPMGIGRSSASMCARRVPRRLADVLPRPDRRGLSGVSLVTSDAHPGLVAAVAATLPGASGRCRTHYAANLMQVTPKPPGAG